MVKVRNITKKKVFGSKVIQPGEEAFISRESAKVLLRSNQVEVVEDGEFRASIATSGKQSTRSNVETNVQGGRRKTVSPTGASKPKSNIRKKSGITKRSSSE